MPGELTLPEGLLPRGVEGAALWIDGVPPALWPGEMLSAGAVEKRRREFAFGRACAREALRALGRPPVAIPIHTDRTPIFPADVVGSLSHSRTLAVAAVGWAHTLHAIGIDIEHDATLDPDLTSIVATEAERRAPEIALGLLFSAKEAAFKCWHRAGGGRLADFHEFELSVRADGTFIAVRQPQPSVPLAGRWARAHGHWWTTCVSP